MLRVCVLAFLVVTVLCGCTSFAVSLELPGVEHADVMLSAEAVKSIDRTKGAELVRCARPGKLQDGKASFTLPFEPAEMLLSITLNGVEGVVHIKSTETEQGETVYQSKCLSKSAADWKVAVVPQDSAGLRITITTGK